MKVDPLMADYISKPDPPEGTPPPEPPPPPPPPGVPPVDDEVVKVKDLIGEKFKSVDEVRSAAERGLRIKDEDLTELESLRQGKARFTELETEVQTLRQMPTLETPEYFRLEHVKKNNPEDLQFYQQLVFGGLSDIELLKRSITRENPIIKDDPAAIQRKLERTYKSYFDPEVDRESQDFKDDQMDIKMDAARIRASYQKTFESIPVPEIKKPEDKTAIISEVTTGWKGVEIKFDGKYSAPFYVDKDYKQTKDFEIEIPTDQLKPFIEAAVQFKINALIKPDTNNVNDVIATAKQLYILKNLPYYNTKIAEFIEAKKDLEWRTRTGNPSVPPPGNINPPAAGDASDQLAKHLGFT
jgi:hypothetical protein